MVNSPTYAQLGATLRSAANSAQRLGDTNHWRPVPGSDTEASWKIASDTHAPLPRTLVEADVQAVLLVRSALAHADAVGRAVSGERPFLPHTIGRVAVEHALRALHLADTDATDPERAERRLEEMLYAVTEGERQRVSFERKTNIDSPGPSSAEKALAEAEYRAAALGLRVASGKRGRRVSARGRPSTMELAERYLAGSHPGVPEFLIRAHGANIHGIETAFLTATTDRVDPTTGINVPVPGLYDPPILALTLMSVPLAVDNAFRAVASRFKWSASGKSWRTWQRSRERQLETWTASINRSLTDPKAL